MFVVLCITGNTLAWTYPRIGITVTLIATLAAMAADLPFLLQNLRSPVATFQSAWIGSILHMTGFLVLGAVVVFMNKPPTAFVIWLLVAYWVTLAGLAAVMVRVMRSAAPAGANTKGE